MEWTSEMINARRREILKRFLEDEMHNLTTSFKLRNLSRRPTRSGFPHIDVRGDLELKYSKGILLATTNV